MQIIIENGPPSREDIETARAAQTQKLKWLGATVLVSVLGLAFSRGWLSLAFSASFLISGLWLNTIASYKTGTILQNLSPDQCEELADLMQQSSTTAQYVEKVNRQGRELVVAELTALTRAARIERDAAKKAAVYGSRGG